MKLYCNKRHNEKCTYRALLSVGTASQPQIRLTKVSAVCWRWCEIALRSGRGLISMTSHSATICSQLNSVSSATLYCTSPQPPGTGSLDSCQCNVNYYSSHALMNWRHYTCMNEWMNEWMMFLLTCDKKLIKSQLSPTHASTKRKITDELKHNAGWYEVREGSPVEVQWAVGG